MFHPRWKTLNEWADAEPLPLKTWGRVHRHLEKCQRCRSIVQNIRKMGQDYRDLPVPKPRPELKERILKLI